MFDLKSLQKLGTEKNILLFQYHKIKRDALKGIETFVNTANRNFKKAGTPIKFEIFIDQVFNNKNVVIAEKVYLNLKDDEGIFSKLDNNIIQNMVFEYLFHMLGMYVNELEDLEDE